MASTAIELRLNRIKHLSRRNLKLPFEFNNFFLRFAVHGLPHLENFNERSTTNVVPSSRRYSTLNHIKPARIATQNFDIFSQNTTIRSFTIPTLACAEYTPTLFGLTPFLLTSFHTLGLPYYAGISLTNILVRSAMIPLVIRGAKTSLSIGVVAPEVQFLITNFRKDFGMLKKREEASGSDDLRKAQLSLVRYTVESLRGIFRLHKVNLLDVFKVSNGLFSNEICGST